MSNKTIDQAKIRYEKRGIQTYKEEKTMGQEENIFK